MKTVYQVIWNDYSKQEDPDEFEPDLGYTSEEFDTFAEADARAREILTNGLDSFGSVEIQWLTEWWDKETGYESRVEAYDRLTHFYGGFEWENGTLIEESK